MFDRETESVIEELADELYEGIAGDHDILYFEGGIVRSAPTGAPPEYITVEVEGIYDENVMWRGVPASLVVGDEVLVWENPITHRREIAGGSGASGTSTSSPWQKINVAVSGGDFALLSAAITWINALAAPIAPAATRQFAINIRGGTFVEAADVTIPQYVHVGGEGEGTVLDMGDATLRLAADTSLQEIVVTSTANDTASVIIIQGDNAVMDDVRVIITGGPNQECVYFNSVDNVELYHVVCESTTIDNYGFNVYDSTVLFWDCHVNDTTNFWLGVYISTAGNPSTITTMFCQFRAASAGHDVWVVANNTWNHFACQFDPDNLNMLGTEVPLTHGKTNFDDVVTFENGFTMDGVSGANIVTIPGAQAIGLTLVDSAAVEYLRLRTVAQLEMHFNDGGADIDFIVEASVADAFVVRGSDSQVTMGILGAGLIETTAGGVLASDYTINSTVTMASGQDIDPTDASGQDLGDATHRWDLYTQDVIFGGASGANVVTVPDNVAQALNLVDAGGLEYARVVSTDAQPVVVWNNGEADVDFRVGVNGFVSDPTSGLFVQGDTGQISMGVAPITTAHLTVRNPTVVPTTHFYGIYQDHTVTDASGATEADDIYGIFSYTAVNAAGQTVGHLRGLSLVAAGIAGNIGDDVEDLMGIYAEARLTGAVVADDLRGLNFVANLDSGSVGGDVYGARIGLDVEAAVTSIGGSAFGLYIFADCDQAPAGTAYTLYFNDQASMDYCVYQAGTNPNYLAGRLAVGGTVAALAQLHADQSGAAAAIPVAYFDQADVSEEMFEFATTIGVGNAIEAVGAKTLTTTHFIKVTLPGALTRYFPVGTIA